VTSLTIAEINQSACEIANEARPQFVWLGARKIAMSKSPGKYLTNATLGEWLAASMT